MKTILTKKLRRPHLKIKVIGVLWLFPSPCCPHLLPNPGSDLSSSSYPHVQVVWLMSEVSVNLFPVSSPLPSSLCCTCPKFVVECTCPLHVVRVFLPLRSPNPPSFSFLCFCWAFWSKVSHVFVCGFIVVYGSTSVSLVFLSLHLVSPALSNAS